MKNILLIEPNYPTKVLPFGLQKIATYLLNKGHSVKYRKGCPTPSGFFGEVPDEIYITSLFTYFGKEVIKTINVSKRLFPKAKIHVGGIFASLMPEYIKKKTGISPHIGLLKKVDNCIPNFDLFPETEKITVFTSRGCFRKCKFCAVKSLEPNFFVVDNWKKQITNSCKNKERLIIVQDNNFTASPWSHQKDAVDFFVKNNLTVDFQQGLDCRLFKEKHVKLYSKLNIPVIRFAFDNIETEDGYIQEAIKLTKKYMPKTEIRSFVLYNFKDKPEDMWYRFGELNKLGTKAYPMKYADISVENIENLKRTFVGEHWNEKFLKNLLNFLIKKSRGSMVIYYSYESFKKHFGKSAKEFVNIIKNYNTIETKRENKKREMGGFDL
ncbi:MAG: cobalamin B12-binding domain-containing protein [Nanoarchaeota archaeon]|nr:cobalamin B12-binding domain-containing protein [Nanoarchaeota archaeon]